MFRINYYLTKNKEQTMTFKLDTHDSIVQLRILSSLMSLTHISVLDLYICHIGFVSHYPCVYSDVLVVWSFPSGFGLWTCFWQEQPCDSRLISRHSHNTLYISQGGLCLCQCASQPLVNHHSCSTRLTTWEEETCNYVKHLNTSQSTTVKSEHASYSPAQRSKSWTSGC